MDTSSGDFAAPSSVVRADSPVMHILFIVCAVGFYFLADRLHLKFLRGVEGERGRTRVAQARATSSLNKSEKPFKRVGLPVVVVLGKVSGMLL